jgi:endoglycosylceramidase
VRLLLAGAIVLVVLGAFAAEASARIQTPLDHAGRWITDPSGRVTVLHGLNMVYKRPPYAPDAVGFGENDAAFLASEGYNTVRVGLIYKAVEPQPGVYDDAYLARIERTVNALGRHGVVSLLDFHQDLYNERFQGEGWPDWAVQDDGLPAQPQAGFPANYLVMPALQRAFDHFWQNDPGPGGVGLQDRYAAAWRHVAERFRDNRYVLGYDLLNEPWPGTAWQQCANPAGCPVFDAMLSAFVTRMLTAIRQVDSTTIVWYEPQVLFNNGSDTNLADFGDAHTGMSFHDYCLTANEGGGGYSAACEASDSLVFQNAEKRSLATGDALLLTEFGATDERESLLGVLSLADKNMMSWQEWHYCGCDDPTTTGSGDTQAIVLDPAKPPSGSNLKTSTLDAVTRPYPQIVAGTPESWSFDPSSRAFALAFSTSRAGGGGGSFGPNAVSEIAVPRRQYTNGYAADVRGGSIRSAAGAAVLKVSACAGATRLTVSLVAGSGAAQSSCAPPPGSAGAARTRLRLSLTPGRVRAGRLVTLRFLVLAGRGSSTAPVRGAVVRLAGKRVVTGRAGKAHLALRFARSGRKVAVATARGYLAGRATVRVFARAPESDD